MDSDLIGNQVERRNLVCSSIIFVIFVFLYGVIYGPLILSDFFISALFRLSVEFLLLSYLLLRLYPLNRVPVIFVLFCTILLVKTPFILDNYDSFLARTNKIIIFYFLQKFVKDKKTVNKFFKYVYLIFTLITLFQIIFGFFVYNFLPGFFKYHDFTPGSNYPYYGNIIFGNILIKRFGTYIVPRMCGYFVEPGVAACFLGINIFTSKVLIKSRLLKNIYNLLNIFAIVLTFSFTGVIAVVTPFISQKFYRSFINSGKGIKIVLLVLVFFLALLSIKVGSTILLYSSISDRAMRFQFAISAIKSMNFLTLLFGYGIGFLGDADRGFTSGILNLIIEQGLIYSVFIAYLLYKTSSSRKDLLVYSVVINFAFDFFAWPLFWIVLIVNTKIKNCQNYELQRKVFQ